MGKYLSDDELISAINHSSEPYVIVEGDDDVMIYRWLLDDIGAIAALEHRQGCGGVKNLFFRKGEITNPKIAFVCDRDTNVYTGKTPKGCGGIIYTKGYSIENDLYYGRKLEKKLFEAKDRELFEKALNSFLLYYGCELEKFSEGKVFDLRRKPEAIINHKDYSLRISQLCNYKEPSTETIEHLKSKYDLLIRGHSLFKLVGMILRRKTRKPQYEVDTIYEMCFKFCKSPNIRVLQKKIKNRIS